MTFVNSIACIRRKLQRWWWLDKKWEGNSWIPQLDASAERQVERHIPVCFLHPQLYVCHPRAAGDQATANPAVCRSNPSACERLSEPSTARTDKIFRILPSECWQIMKSSTVKFRLFNPILLKALWVGLHIVSSQYSFIGGMEGWVNLDGDW